jgi:hypothetical protein
MAPECSQPRAAARRVAIAGSSQQATLRSLGDERVRAIVAGYLDA